MIHVESVTAALTALLTSDAVLVSSGCTVQESAPFNRDLNLTPWLGIYPGRLALEPLTVGGSQPWDGRLELLVYVQTGGHEGGESVTRRLAATQHRVLELLAANLTLAGTALMLERLEASPFQRDLQDDAWLFTNEIALDVALRG